MIPGYETEELMEAHIKALLKEAEDAERAGNGLRAEQARASLRAFGYQVSKPQARAEKRGPGRPKKNA